MTERARLVVVAPGGATVDVAPPPLTGAGGSELRDLTASRVGGAMVVGACVATPLPGWVEDMRPAVTARAHAWTAKLAERTVGPVEIRDLDGEGVGDLHAVAAGAVAAGAGAAGAGGGTPLGRARVLVGFEDGTDARVLTCGVACAARVGISEDERRACDAIVRASHLEHDTLPPPPGAALRAVAWAVHHPSPTALAAGGLAALGLLALVALRRRPRSRL